MSVPIGLSFGDVVESIKILHRVVHAIKDHRHASEGYQSICHQVEEHILVLQQLQSIKLDRRYAQYTQAIHTLSKELESTARSIQVSLSRHGQALAAGSTASRYRRIVSSATWAVKINKSVENQLSRLNTQTQSLTKLISCLQIELLSTIVVNTDEALSLQRLVDPWKSRVEGILTGIEDNRKRSHERLERINATADKASCNTLDLIRSDISLIRDFQQQALKNIERNANDSKRRDQELIADLISRIVLAVSQRREASFTKDSDGIETRKGRAGAHISDDSPIPLPELALLRNQASGLVLDRDSETSATDFSILRLIMMLLAGLVRRFIHRLVRLAPAISLNATPSYFLPDDILLKDSLGRFHRLPVRLFQSWDLVTAYLEFQFRGLPGELKVLNREFNILDVSSPSSTIGPMEWERVARQRGRFLMSMAFPSILLNKTRCIKCTSPLRKCGEAGYICPRDTCGVFFHVLRSSPTPSRDSSHADNEEEWMKVLAPHAHTLSWSESSFFSAARGSTIALTRVCLNFCQRNRFLFYSHADVTLDSSTPLGPSPQPASGRNHAFGTTENFLPEDRRVQEATQDRDLQSFCTISLQRPTLLYDAASKNDLDLARRLLRAGHDINESVGQLGVAINAALVLNHSDMLDLLLEHGASLLPPAIHPRLSPLCVAAQHTQPHLAAKVFTTASLRANQNPEQYQGSLDAALCASIRRRDGILTEAILGLGANPIRAQDDGHSALELSLSATSKHGDRDVLAAVLVFGLLARNLVSVEEVSDLLIDAGYPTDKQTSYREPRRDRIVTFQKKVSRRISPKSQFFLDSPCVKLRKTVPNCDVKTMSHPYEILLSLNFNPNLYSF